MEKLDFFMSCLGIFAYIAIMYDFRENEKKQLRAMEMEEKRRMYRERILEDRRRKKMQELEQEKKALRAREMESITAAVERLNDFEKTKIMRESRVTAGKIAL